ncbi:aminotransferase class III-fold pyridoxal phosphate-dependent enzyme [Sinosporangium siamense]|uniref:(S)-3-amino-2-methylpropionate transaminase n=1 Tax=Sinosporangium siamense TaxID=1367973 RepID=A0A919RLQ1_9ACTN|nr:aminotransferase class III-fold pyridoxal phosphate-dependent enzyme [Sinosporangium siamense]GII95135.1 aspartate aminotransferase family protein [Sinosporangium siamense]
MSPTLSEQAARLFPPAAARHTDLAIVSAEGAYVTTDDGRVILDFASGVAVTNVGHGHPAVMARVRAQLDTLVHAGHNVGVYPTYIELAAELVELAGGDRKVFFANSGAEALEGAVKLALHVTGRAGLIAFKGGFHGRTLGTTALSASASAYRGGYLAALPAVNHLDYPSAFARQETEEAEVRRCLAQLDEYFDLVVPADRVAAIVVEPIQGEGGYLPAPAAFLRGLRERCDRHGIVLIFDEIQSGFGRAGDMFAYQDSGVVPDALVLAKGIANGFPLSALVANAELMQRWPAGAHGGTFGGNPVACAAALGVLEVLRDGALANARTVGARLRDGLADIARHLPYRTDVRGRGVMLGVELRHNDHTPAVEAVARVRAAALESGLLVLSCGVHRNVLRLMPPTTLTAAEADSALDILAKAMTVA